MFRHLFPALALSSVFVASTASADSFSCASPESRQFIFASVNDEFHKEGEVTVVSARKNDVSETALYSEYAAQNGEQRRRFSKGTFSLDINAEGTDGALTTADGRKEAVLCKAYTGKTEKVALALEILNARYQIFGEDNNDLGIQTSEKPALNVDADAVSLQSEELPQAIRDCVLIEEGAYGAHITKNRQSRLMKGFLKDLDTLARQVGTLRYYRSAELLGNPDTLSAPECSLIVEINGSTSVMVNATQLD